MNIKRPAILFLSAFIVGIIIAYEGVPRLFKLLLLLCAIFLYLKLFFETFAKDRKNFISLFVLIIVGFFIFLGYFRFKIEENKFDSYNTVLSGLARGMQEINGKVSGMGNSTNSQYVDIDDVVVNGQNVGNARCYYPIEYEMDLKIGQMVSAAASIFLVEPPDNEGEFNQQNYNRSNNISFTAYAKSFNVVNEDYDKIRQKIYDIKIIIKEQITKIFDGNDAGLFSAMVTGDKSTIDKEQKRLFNENGIAHILAISGLHLSILGLAIFEFLRKKFSIKFSATVVSIFILLYGMFIDAGATSLRAITMLYIRFWSLSIGRSYDSKNTLYIICFIFLMLHPYLIFNAGFQFSYVAIYALNTEVRFRNGKKLPVVITLTLFLFPITVFHYFTYPIYSIVLNLIVIPLMSFVLGFGLVGLMISFLVLKIGRMFTYVVHLIFLLYEWLCYSIEKLPCHKILLGKPNIYEILYFYIALFLIIYVINKGIDFDKNKLMRKILDKTDVESDDRFRLLKHKIPIFRVVICSILLVMSILIMGIRVKPECRLTFVSIGQGDSILIESNDDIITIDGGSSSNKSAGQYVLTPHIKSRAIDHIDYAFITHSDDDHTNGIMYLITDDDDDVKVRNLVLPINAVSDKSFNKLINVASESQINLMYLKTGDTLDINKDMHITVLSPSEEVCETNKTAKKKDKLDVNNMSLTFRLDYKDHSALFTGDIGKEMESRLVNDEFATSLLGAEILKVPHHGSKNSNHPAFFKLVSPKFSVFSYGRGNTYGHPHEITVESLAYLESTILKTGESGQIDLYLDEPDVITYKTYR